MNVLFLVHIEEMFRKWFPDPAYGARIARSTSAGKYERVFILNSGLDEEGPDGRRGIIGEVVWNSYPHYCVPRNVYIEDWSWGYEPGCMYNAEENNWVIQSHGHDWTWVPNFLRDSIHYFKAANIFVGGGGRGACLADWESVLWYLNIPYTSIDGLIY